MARGDYYLRELELAPGERALLSVAGAAALAQPAFPFRTDLAHALDKLLFEGDRRRRGAAAEASRFVVHLPTSGAAAQQPVLEALGRAVASRKDVHLTYESFAGELTSRTVSPYGLAYRRGAWFFVGHCQLRSGLRTFQAERVRKLTLNELRPRHPDFEVPEGFSVREHVALEPWQYQVHPPLQVEVRLDRPVALLARPHFGASATVLPEPDGGVLLRLTCTNGEAVVREVLALSPHAELVAPVSLRQRVAAAAERIATAHERSS